MCSLVVFVKRAICWLSLLDRIASSEYLSSTIDEVRMPKSFFRVVLMALYIHCSRLRELSQCKFYVTKLLFDRAPLHFLSYYSHLRDVALGRQLVSINYFSPSPLLFLN